MSGHFRTTTDMGADIEVEPDPCAGEILLVIDGHVHRLTDGQAEALADALSWAVVEVNE